MSRLEFDHFVLTRFNVRGDAESSFPADDWLRARLDIFRQWCLPSIRSQTVAPDYWLIFCDSKSSTWFREELSSLLRPGEEIVWVEGPSSVRMFIDAIMKRSRKGYLITTRLDNDDAIACDFVEMVQDCFDGQEREFINFTYGAQYCNGRCFIRIDPSNPFISLIEKRSDAAPMTVHIDWHNRLERHGSVRRVRSHLAWLQHVHGGNVANVVRGIPVRPEKALRYFSLSVPVKPMSRLAMCWSIFMTSGMLAIRVLSSAHRIKWLLLSLWSRGKKFDSKTPRGTNEKMGF